MHRRADIKTKYAGQKVNNKIRVLKFDSEVTTADATVALLTTSTCQITLSL